MRAVSIEPETPLPPCQLSTVNQQTGQNTLGIEMLLKEASIPGLSVCVCVCTLKPNGRQETSIFWLLQRTRDLGTALEP